MHTTNYYNAFIEIAVDSEVQVAQVPPQKDGPKTIARIQYEILVANPYEYTSDDVLFTTFAIRTSIAQENIPQQREIFFSKGQPCFRASPLTKTYGWGVHSNDEGKIALFAKKSDEYKALAGNTKLRHLKAMRSKKA